MWFHKEAHVPEVKELRNPACALMPMSFGLARTGDWRPARVYRTAALDYASASMPLSDAEAPPAPNVRLGSLLESSDGYFDR
jgi:hypothetical protein